MNPRVQVINHLNPNRLSTLRQSLRGVSGREVAIGYPANASGLGEPWYEGGASIIDVAIRNNYGIGVPRRPFMDMARGKIQELYREKIRAIQAQIREGNVDVDRLLNTIGMLAAEEVRKAIFDGGWEPNSTATIRQKRSERPLVDTGEMVRRATWLVRDAS